MTNAQILLIKVGYLYLFVLALIALLRSMKIAALAKTSNQVNPLLKFILLAILYLSIFQSYQTIAMIRDKLNSGWWIPFFCKHGALAIYHIALSFIKYKLTSNDTYPACNGKLSDNNTDHDLNLNNRFNLFKKPSIDTHNPNSQAIEVFSHV